LDKARKEDNELSEAYLSFENRLAQDTTTTNIEVKNQEVDLTIRLKSLMDILGGRTSFKDMDTQHLKILFESAIKELNWLLSMESDQSIDAQHVRSTMLLNANNSFFQMLMNETNTSTGINTNNTCHSYVKLDEGTISNEFIPPKNSPKVATETIPPAITKDTACESDLAYFVEQIKNKILVQKDKQKLIEVKVRSMIRSMITSMKEKRQAVLVQEKQMRNYWLDKIETLQNEYTKDLNDKNIIHKTADDKELCASSDVIKGMVTGGLEAVRQQNDPYNAIVEAALGAAVAAGTSDETMMSLTNEIELMNVPTIEHDMLTPPPPSKMTTKNFIIDGSLLVRGMVGWIDFVVDSISGYNGKIIHVDVQ
jgi:hypothetical protein